MGTGAPKDLSECRGFFLEPATAKQRMYEALRAYFVEGRPSSEVAQDFGYSPGSFQVLCHHSSFRVDLKHKAPLIQLFWDHQNWGCGPVSNRSAGYDRPTRPSDRYIRRADS